MAPNSLSTSQSDDFASGKLNPTSSLKQQTSPRVLVVDDVADNREILARQMIKQNFQVAEAENGIETLRVLEQQKCDLVLLDIMMPGVSGIDVLRTLRTTRTDTDLPIIMVSARNESESVVESLNLGANDYVTKPVDLPILFARINAQLTRKRIAEQQEERQTRVASNALKLQNHSEALLSAIRALAADAARKDSSDAGRTESSEIGGAGTSGDHAVRKRRIVKSAKIVLNGRKSVIDCIIWEMNESGALLRVESVSGVPDEFELAIEGKSTVDCYVMQRRLGEVLVGFA